MPLTLAGLSSLCTLARLLPERDPHPSLFEITLFVLGYLDEPRVWPALMVRWEMALLDELGFGLDLSACAATGSRDGLVYVSPKSGRAVSAAAGEPYKDRLLALPAFLAKGARQGPGAARSARRPRSRRPTLPPDWSLPAIFSRRACSAPAARRCRTRACACVS